MFQFPRLPRHTYVFSMPYPLARLGFPIRKSSDHSLVGSSPRHIAASHVLHRQQMPRHPPHALSIFLLESRRVIEYAGKADWLQGHVYLPLHYFVTNQNNFVLPATRKSLKTFLSLVERAYSCHVRDSYSLVKECDVFFLRRTYHSGGYRARTDDLRLAKPSLSQLS